MAFNVLSQLQRIEKLNSAEILYSQEGSIKVLFGSDVTDFNRSGITHIGGETGYEKFFVQLENIREIRLEGKIVWKKKKRIEKILPRS